MVWGDNQGSESRNWKGGRIINDQGYVLIASSEHPRVHKGYVREHILVMEKSLGRPILPSEAIHHIDGDRKNNSVGNLILFKTNKMHLAYHRRLVAFEVCGYYEWRKCIYCRQYGDVSSLYISPNNEQAYHRSCVNIYNQKRYASKSNSK